MVGDVPTIIYLVTFCFVFNFQQAKHKSSKLSSLTSDPLHEFEVAVPAISSNIQLKDSLDSLSSSFEWLYLQYWPGSALLNIKAA